ncbi:virulence factor SrfB [Sphingobacterium paramultivorum]|uniref:Virulence factor SrfB n=1 Tax=Sphingobacterium paramultivorum TaxID=2886510 RepID=A0A7G5E453_9SPHI|nr:virulence factor SrfB [Sphingobacterium paramultivorum]QMV68778.1 virulence factor SrfB [Sphingobacterium paramultivorum]WSO12542.1 virulence factor SrfB [Sphingobacterium paramultivorum]
MKRISLIANSSIQYYKYEVNIDLEFGKENRFYYHQPFDTNFFDFILDPLFKVTKEGTENYYRLQELIDKGFVINKRLKDEADLSTCTGIVTEVYEESNLKQTLKQYQNKWIPLPFFKENAINRDLLYPTDWVRVFFTCDEEFSLAKIVIAVDTSLARSENDKTGPQLSNNPDENVFRLQSDEINLSNFLFTQDNSVAWIDRYLADLFYDRNEEDRYTHPIKKYIAKYVLLIKWLAAQTESPEIQLFTDNIRKKTVDLVIDIGNSATCALLFENKDDDSFDFDSVKKLIIQDYTNPHLEYNNSFPMNMMFSESSFGNIDKDNYHNNKFIVPSLTRIGFEAEKLIHSASTNLDLGYELKTYNSSPKRYLWDDQISDREWEFQPLKTNRVKKVYLNGISEQLSLDGSLKSSREVFGAKSMFSRASLMKFVFLEVLMHAHVQINSFKFREEHGEMTMPRTIKRITISCPTGMIQHEQIALRQAAAEACELLDGYQRFYFDQDENTNWFKKPEIIPSIQDISKTLSQLEDKKDWMYDEATCSQLVFVYSLFSKKLRSNNYVIDHFLFNNKNTLKIASIDIGAGTTDIIINQYQLKTSNKIQELIPQPLFWDSFKLAGDDLMKELIQKLIIRSTLKTDDSAIEGLENYGRSKGIIDIQSRINGFFGENSNNMGYLAKMMRKSFVHQVAQPIVLKYLQQANQQESLEMSFEEIIGHKFENSALVNYFERIIGFNFLEIRWTISAKVVNEIVSSVFEGLVRQMCLVINQFECDFVVLSGKPASLLSYEELFKKFLFVSPTNVINLNNYWIGKWYPFADNLGNVEDPKTIVAVGAIIALMAAKLKKIQDFNLNTTELIKNLSSTADHIISKVENRKEVILTPQKHEQTFLLKSLPFEFGYAKYLSRNYTYSGLYRLSIDHRQIEEVIKNRFVGRDESFYEEQVDKERGEILRHLPLKVTIARDWDESKEILKIEHIEDNEGNEKPGRFFQLHYQTLDSVQGYWLDTCEFVL